MTYSRKPRSSGRHRAPSKSRAAMTTVATASFAALVAATFGGAGFAVAAPGDQAGVTSEVPGQVGVTAPAPQAPVETWTPVPEVYRQPAKPYVSPAYYGDPAPPIDYSTLHLPVQLDTFTAPVQAPAERLRFGRYETDLPNWISKDTGEKTNGQTAVVEAQTTDFWRSTGLETGEAERLAASQIGGGAVGVLAGASAAAAPAGAAGALIGGTIGGTSAVGLASALVTPLGVIPAGVVGTAAGAGIGAAALALPAAVVGGIAGGAGGALAASAYGAGDLGRPVEFDIPDIDQSAITDQTRSTLEQWSSDSPAGAAVVDAVRATVSSAPSVDRQLREAVAALPGGSGIVASVDQGVSGILAATTVPGLPISMIADAIGGGISE
ncbi:hypothetical protein ABH922_004397 [Rhodococcus sp. 27YEA15]|uniref:insoluble domain protein n=1 Tax=Rhodococcus sp. 27YEA15 TaxID=3156259 RepID=UPI003C7BB713